MGTLHPDSHLQLLNNRVRASKPLTVVLGLDVADIQLPHAGATHKGFW